MASRKARPAVLDRNEVHRHGPPAEKTSLLHMLVLTVVGMHLVTCPAGTSFPDLVHVHKMQVPLTITESCRDLRLLLRKCRLVVTGEAERIFSVRIGSIKFRRIVLGQDPPEVGSMGIMTGDASSAFDGSVAVLVLIEQRLHVRDLAPPRLKLF